MVREREKRKGSDEDGSCVWWSGNGKRGREVMEKAALSGGQETGKEEGK